MKNKKNIVIIISIFVVFFIVGFLFGTTDQKAENKAVFENATLVEYEKNGGKIAMYIPEGWEYTINKEGLEHLLVNFSIDFKPEGIDGGYISVSYRESFGVCGTELNVEEITVGEYKAVKGTYGYASYWSYINFLDTEGICIANNDTAFWYYQYSDEVMEILSTVKLG